MSSLVEKLKEGLQDAVVFLRTLEQFRIPPVVERRRKELLEKLVHLQGDTLREEPPRFEPIDEEEEKAKRLKRTDSKVGDRVKEIEDTDTASKPKDAKSQKPQEQTAKGDKEVSGKKAKEAAEEGSSTLTSAASEAGNELSPEQTSTSGSCENLNKQDEKEKKKGLGFRLRRNRGKDKEKSEKRAVSPARPESQVDDETQKEEPSPKQEQEEEKEVPVEDEDVKLQMQLERRVPKRFGGHQWQKVNVTLREFTLCIGNKDKVDLVGCTVMTTDAGFDLCSHPEHKSFIFRTENSEVKDKCVSTLQTAIEECNPAPSTPEQPEDSAKPEEAMNEKQDEVPKITVQDEEEQPADITEERQPGESESQAKKKKESRVAPAPKIRKLPDQGVQMKGYMYRKTWKGWEKCWCVLTYNALYFTGMEENGEYSHMLPINQEESGGSIKEKKGHDRQSKGLIIKPNKKSKSETVSIESSEFTQWYRQLEQVIGISGVEELLSEDEGEVGLIDEELYEEVDQPPAVPASPRPPHVPLASSIPVSDTFQDMGGEEIYEEFDDPLDVIPETVSPQHQAPTLPQRNQPKNEPSPALPARNAPPTKVGSPALPTRNIPAKSRFASDVQDYEVASPPARTKVGIPAHPPPPPTAPIAETCDDDTYDDIVRVMGQGEIEEMYDDVVTPTTTETKPERSSLMSEENYEDMAPGEDGPTEDYVIMEPGEQGDDGGLYLEVDDDKPPSYALAQRKHLADQQKDSSPKTGTFSKIFGGAKTKPAATTAATATAMATATATAAITKSQLSYKAPKKSKFSDEWCAIEGTTLQFFKSSTDKKPRDKLAINECNLKIGSTEAGSGEFTFRLTKGDKVHHFSMKTKEDLEGWITALKVIAKSVAIDLGDSVFQAKEDHIGEGEDQLTFKKGTYIRLITQTSGEMWIGQIGIDAQVFNGKIGKFPTSKVAVVEDLYV